MKYVPPVNGDTGDPDRSWVNEDVGLGIEGSIPDAAAFEHTLRELVHLITQAGLTPDGGDLTQVAQAVSALASGSYDLAFHAGWGSDGLGEDLAVQTYAALRTARAIEIAGDAGGAEVDPTGADIEFDVTDDGVSIYTTKPTYSTAGVYTAGVLTSDPDPLAVAVDSLLEFKITAVGSTVRGQKATFTLIAAVA